MTLASPGASILRVNVNVSSVDIASKAMRIESLVASLTLLITTGSLYYLNRLRVELLLLKALKPPLTLNTWSAPRDLHRAKLWAEQTVTTL